MDKDLLKSAEQRGFSVQFPQAIIEPTFYLPFKANLILEVPDWSGKVEKFGSLSNLVEELTETLAIVKQADPKGPRPGRMTPIMRIAWPALITRRASNSRWPELA